MMERVALIVATIASFGALIGLLMRLDRSLFIIRYQFSLLTLLLLLAVAPPLSAVGYWAWKTHKPPRSRWYGNDSEIVRPPIRDVDRWKLTRSGPFEVPDDKLAE